MFKDVFDTLDSIEELPDSYNVYATEELKKDIGDRWEPKDRPLASEFYGKYKDKIAIVVGSGHSLKRDLPHLQNLGDDFVTIAVSSAISSIKSDFWLFVDHDTYTRLGNHPNALAAKRLGVDRFWPLYDPGVHIWRRSYTEKHVLEEGRLFHQNTSLLAAIHFAFKLGCRLVVTVGCDMYLKPNTKISKELMGKFKTKEEWVRMMNFTFVRIIMSLRYTLKYWKDPNATLIDASCGMMPCPQIALPKILAKVKEKSDGCIISA